MHRYRSGSSGSGSLRHLQIEEPVEWILITNHPVETVQAALLIKSWYEWRWTIEELHKAMKTEYASFCWVIRL